MPTATIKLFLIQGDPSRLRTAEIMNMNIKTLAAPRVEMDDLLKRDEMSSAGVYILIGYDIETGKPALYIGEAEILRGRLKSHMLKSHIKDDDFWNQVIAIVSKDEVLTKAHIKHIEGRLIEDAAKANRAKILNSQSSGSRLPESDLADMEVFIENIHQLLPVMGSSHFAKVTEQYSESREDTSLFCEIKGLRASGQQTVNGFVIFKGSQAVLENRSSTEKWPWPAEMRQKLINDDVLVQVDNHLVFQEDVEFSSPSAAASVIHGGHANGRTAWKNKDGITIKEMEEKLAG